jgi:stage II sporulation protein D
METFGKASKGPGETSATVTRVGRHVLRPGAVCLLLLGGLASSIFTGSSLGFGSTTPSTTTTAAVTSAAATTTTSAAAAVLAFSGHGWGHGLGLSQWGAYGYARHGWTYDRILAHYYTGTTLGPAKVSTVRVLVASAAKTTLASAVPWTVTDSAGQKAVLEPGKLVLKRSPAIAAQPALLPPFAFSSTQPLEVDGKTYRGKLTVSGDGKLVQVVDRLGLEAYLRGVVSSEMPSNWPAEALEAQAVAARSYTLANLTKGRAFDLYGDTRDQAYGGVAAESAGASAAIDATKGQVVLYQGKVADTLYSSTSGGRTASALESIGSAVPYLVPVADPYDTLSPYHDWGPVLFDAAKVAKQLKLSAPLADLEAANGPSGRVKTVIALSNDDAQVTFTGNQLRTALDLRSTWFAPAFLQLLPATKTMTVGGAVTLTGIARGVDRLSLEAKQAGQTEWSAAGDLAVGPDGRFSAVVKPSLTTQYRLAWDTVRAGLAKIAVAPRVEATAGPSAVQGTIHPLVVSAAVQLQQQAGTAWTTLSSSVTDATGAWSFSGALLPGTYRVRCAPGHGLAPGFSTPFVVQ